MVILKATPFRLMAAIALLLGLWFAQSAWISDLPQESGIVLSLGDDSQDDDQPALIRTSPPVSGAVSPSRPEPAEPVPVTPTSFSPPYRPPAEPV